MKLCNICEKTVAHLQPGPPEMEPACETCDERSQDLLRRFAAGERRRAEMKRQMRLEAIRDWRRERGPKGGIGPCSSLFVDVGEVRRGLPKTNLASR